MSYAPHSRLVAGALRRPGLGRLALGLLCIAVTAFLGAQAVFALIALASSNDPGRAIAGLAAADTPAGLLLMLAAMGLLGLATWIAARLVHGRGFWSLVGPPRQTLAQGLRVFAATGALAALGLGLMAAAGGGDLSPNLAPTTWALLLPVSVAAVLVQTGSEELLFRGYLQSQLAARFRSPLVWIGVPSAIFAAGHYAASFGPNALAVALWAGLFGVLAADLTARAGTLGPAIALHFVNNATALLFVSMEGAMSGLSLYTLPFSAADAAEVARALPVDFVALLLSWGAARLVLRA